MRDGTLNQREEKFNVDLSSFYSATKKPWIWARFRIECLLCFQKFSVSSSTPHLCFTRATFVQSKLCLSVFFSGVCSSDDEISEKPLLTLKPSELHSKPSQSGNAHTYTRTQASTVFLWTQCVLSSVDDGSDWSTLTAESGEDTPPWPVGMETEECEVVRCVCEVDEENDFMIQVMHSFTVSRATKIRKKNQTFCFSCTCVSPSNMWLCVCVCVSVCSVNPVYVGSMAHVWDYMRTMSHITTSVITADILQVCNHVQVVGCNLIVAANIYIINVNSE